MSYYYFLKGRRSESDDARSAPFCEGKVFGYFSIIFLEDLSICEVNEHSGCAMYKDLPLK